MKQKLIIKQVLTCWLLIVFTISFSPRSYFHEAIANHIDEVSCLHELEKTKACLHEKGFNCHINNLVVGTSYLSVTGIPCITERKVYTEFLYIFSPTPSQFCFEINESRGPPAA